MAGLWAVAFVAAQQVTVSDAVGTHDAIVGMQETRYGSEPLTQGDVMKKQMAAERMVGERVELHPCTDAWAQGDRYGEIVSVIRARGRTYGRAGW